jgi:hypothetical protein
MTILELVREAIYPLRDRGDGTLAPILHERCKSK